MELSAGTAVDRYVVVGPLGKGGMATVLLVRHQRLGTLHALKVLHGGSHSIRERLLREGQVQGSLRHSNVLPVTDVIDVDGAPGLVMEYVSGPDLSRLLATRRLSLDEADALARPILDGVVAAHQAGLVHRDLKPANVLLALESERIVPKVADFGLAKALGADALPGAHKTRSGMAMGTPAYMAPEQVRDASSVDGRADVFALGCILYELVGGHTPFQGQDSFEILRSVVDGTYVDVRELADLPDGLADAIHQALQPQLADRTPSVEALRTAWIQGRSAPQPDWTGLLVAARTLERQPPDPATWSGAADQTWAQTLDPSTPFSDATVDPPDADLSASPPAAAPAIPATPSRPWMGVALVALVALAGVAAMTLWQANPPQPPLHVLTSTSTVPVSSDPVIQTQFDQGWQAFLDADFQGAERKLEQVVATDPPDPLPWFLLAQTRLAQSHATDGVDAVWVAVEKARSFPSPLSDLFPHMVRMAVAEGWDSPHGQAFLDYVAQHPTDYLVPMGPLYSPASADAPEHTVQALFDGILAQDDTRAAPYAMHASGRISRGLWDEAVQVADRGLVHSPGSPALLARKGAAQLRGGQATEAKAVLLEASQLDPGMAAVRLDLMLVALLTQDKALYDELYGQLTGPTVPPQERMALAMELAPTLIAHGRVADGRRVLEDAEADMVARQDWQSAFEMAAQRMNLSAMTGDLDGWEHWLDRSREHMFAPEVSSENRHHHLAMLQTRRAKLLVQRGDLPGAQAIRDRLAKLTDVNPRHLTSVDNAIAVAERRPDDLISDYYEDRCAHRLAAQLDHHAAGATVDWTPLLADSTCSAVGIDQLMLSAARHVSQTGARFPTLAEGAPPAE